MIIYERMRYEGYDPQKGDILDAELLQAFRKNFKKASRVEVKPIFHKVESDKAVDSIRNLSQLQYPTSVDIRAKDITNENRFSISFHGNILPFTLFLAFHIQSEETFYYYRFDPIYIDLEVLETLIDTIHFL